MGLARGKVETLQFPPPPSRSPRPRRAVPFDVEQDQRRPELHRDLAKRVPEALAILLLDQEPRPGTSHLGCCPRCDPASAPRPRACARRGFWSCRGTRSVPLRRARRGRRGLVAKQPQALVDLEEHPAPGRRRRHPRPRTRGRTQAPGPDAPRSAPRRHRCRRPGRGRSGHPGRRGRTPGQLIRSRVPALPEGAGNKQPVDRRPTVRTPARLARCGRAPRGRFMKTPWEYTGLRQRRSAPSSPRRSLAAAPRPPAPRTLRLPQARSRRHSPPRQLRPARCFAPPRRVRSTPAPAWPRRACTLSTADGGTTVAGTCHTTVDGASLACAPNPPAPPQELVTPCVGKTAGDACTEAEPFDDNDRPGVCVTARDGATLICGRVHTPTQGAIDACATAAAGDACTLPDNSGPGTGIGVCSLGPASTGPLACTRAQGSPGCTAKWPAPAHAGAACTEGRGHDVDRHLRDPCGRRRRRAWWLAPASAASFAAMDTAKHGRWGGSPPRRR